MIKSGNNHGGHWHPGKGKGASPHHVYIYIYYRYYHYFPRLPVLVAPADQHLVLTASPCRLHCRIYRRGIKSHHALPLWRSYGWHKVLPFWTMWVDVGSCGAVEKWVCNFVVEIEFRIVFLLFSCCMKKSLVGGGTVSSSIFFWVRSISMWIPNNGIHWSRWLRLIGTSDV